MTVHPAEVSAHSLLIRIGGEMQRCRDLLERIEEEVLPLVSHPIAPTLRAALQDIDLLSQCMDDISRCVQGVSGALDPCDMVNAEAILSKIRLQDMRLRLEGGAYDSRKLTKREEMFDQPPASTSANSHLF
ncbi:MAG: hypothetical protein ACK4SS_07740 [Cypionkella sp.]